MLPKVSAAGGRLTVATADVQWFARLSGDTSPVHVDADWAAATFPGAIVAHGMHLLLLSLDEYARTEAGRPVSSVQVRFRKPVFAGEPFEIRAGANRIEVFVRDEPVVDVRIGQRTAAGPQLTDMAVAPHRHATPRDRTGEALRGVSGAVALPEEAAALVEAFPAAAALVGPDRILGLAGISLLVGMECPGLRSMCSELAVSLTHEPARDVLTYRVTRHDPAFGRVEMEVAGFGVAGTVAALVGQAPGEPLSDEALRELISPEEFAGQAPLVVGGTSGLGRATARLLAAGGAHPILAWHRSSDDANRAAADLGRLGARVQLVRFDARDPGTGLASLAEIGWRGGQLYYFASPRIVRRRLEPYEIDDLRDFLDVYVNGFYRLVRGLMKMRGAAGLSVFYPSMSDAEEAVLDLFEYRMAKTVGEQVCARLEQRYPGLCITVGRLARASTRQTRNFVRLHAGVPEHIMLPIVRQVQARRPFVEE